jgi:hypothetical protein
MGRWWVRSADCETRLLARVLLACSVCLVPALAHAQFLNVTPETRPPARPDAVRVDEVVAAIELEGDERPPVFVLASEVELSLRFELATRGAPSPITTQVHVSVSRGILEQSVGERLLEREAARAGDPLPSDADVDEERMLVATRLANIGGPEAFVRALGLSDDDFEVFVRRRLIVSRFLEHHLARSIEPSEAELRAAYEQEQFGAYRAEGVAFNVARHEIRENLMRQGYPAAIRSYLRSLGGRAHIRLWEG